PTPTASCPMYRWQKPPILPSAYASAQRSSKRRMSSISRSMSLRVGAGVSSVRRAPDGGGAVFTDESDFFLGIEAATYGVRAAWRSGVTARRDDRAITP